MRSSIYIDNLTVIDHAYLAEDGFIRGRSFNLSVIVSGEVPEDDAEQVVIDFSKCKKLIKQCIDDNTNGFDHKLWVDVIDKRITFSKVADIAIIKTDSTRLELPVNAVKLVSLFDINSFIRLHIKSFLSNHYPKINIDVLVELNEDKFVNTSDDDDITTYYFNYVHGLKDSSSYGCQAQNHGHSSYIDIKTKTGNDVQLDISKDNIFIFNKNIVENNQYFIAIEYTTVRGYFYSKYDKLKYKEEGIDIIVINTETTIEHLLEYIDTLIYPGIKDQLCYLKCSEGTQKGAIKLY